jgi:SET domain-containing protein 6
MLLHAVMVSLFHQGEEIMNTYGKLSNASLLHTYGFTEDDNPHDEVSFLLLFCSSSHSTPPRTDVIFHVI